MGGRCLVNHLAQLIQRQITHRFGEDRVQSGFYRLPIRIFPIAFFLTRFQAAFSRLGILVQFVPFVQEGLSSPFTLVRISW